jgi:manganese/iron transport system permease protein
MRVLIEPFRSAYMQRALLELVVLSVLAGVVGTHVVLRKLAFVGDAVTHTIFPGIAIAFAVHSSLFAGALIAGALSAVLIGLLPRIRRVADDSAIAIVLTSFFAVGVLVVSRRRSFTSDLTTLLYGRLLAVSNREIVETLIVAAIVLAVALALHKEFVMRAFDAAGTEALGYRLPVLDVVLNLIVVLVVVAALRSVGTLLVLALLVTPAAVARLLNRRVGQMMVAAVFVAGAASWLGLGLSFEASVHHGWRVGGGPAVVVVLTAVFVGVRAGRSLLVRREAMA